MADCGDAFQSGIVMIVNMDGWMVQMDGLYIRTDRYFVDSRRSMRLGSSQNVHRMKSRTAVHQYIALLA